MNVIVIGAAAVGVGLFMLSRRGQREPFDVPPQPSWQPSPLLSVTSEPSGALVYVNEESTGHRTPMVRYPVAAGAVRVKVRFPSGRFSESRLAAMREGANINMFIRERS